MARSGFAAWISCRSFTGFVGLAANGQIRFAFDGVSKAFANHGVIFD